MYGDGGGKLPIRDMVDPIDITIERMRNKDPEQVTFSEKEKEAAKVNANARLETIKKRGKVPLIYHQINVTQPYSTLNLMFEVNQTNTRRLVVLARHNKMPTIENCEFVKIIGNIQARDNDG